MTKNYWNVSSFWLHSGFKIYKEERYHWIWFIQLQKYNLKEYRKSRNEKTRPNFFCNDDLHIETKFQIFRSNSLKMKRGTCSNENLFWFVEWLTSPSEDALETTEPLGLAHAVIAVEVKVIIVRLVLALAGRLGDAQFAQVLGHQCRFLADRSNLVRKHTWQGRYVISRQLSKGMMHSAEKCKIKRATVSSQTFVALGRSLWSYSFQSTIAWPLGCKYGTILCYGEIVSERAPT